MKHPLRFGFVLVLLLAAGCAVLAPVPTPTHPPTSATSLAPTITAGIPTATLTPTPIPATPTITPQPKTPLVLLKGPYLLFGESPAEMRVLWQSEQPADYQFEWGTDASYSSGSLFPQGDLETQLYQVDLSGLFPGAHYYYRISTEKDEFTGDFLTPPLDSGNLVFYAFGDTRSGPATHDLIAGDILAQIAAKPSAQTFVISTGDLMDVADEQNLQDNEFSPDQPRMRTLLASLPIVNVMGNHDDLALFKKYFPYPFTTTYDWSFDYGPVHFTVIDQYIPLNPGSKRWEWLKEDLASSTSQWKIILLHEPGWSAGPHDNNQMVQEVIQPLAEEYGVDVMIAGHNHYYARANVNGVLHITTGGGGAPLYYPRNGWPKVENTIRAYHYIKIKVTGNSLKVLAISPQGEILDEITIFDQEDR